MKLFLQDIKSCKKNFKILFLQHFDQILQDNHLIIFCCKILARFCISCKKSYIFSARFARYVQDLMQDLARKILVRFAYFLQDGFYWIVCAVLDGEDWLIQAAESSCKTVVIRHTSYCSTEHY